MLELGHIERNPMGSRNVVMGDEFNILQNQAKKSWMNKKTNKTNCELVWDISDLECNMS